MLELWFPRASALCLRLKVSHRHCCRDVWCVLPGNCATHTLRWGPSLMLQSLQYLRRNRVIFFVVVPGLRRWCLRERSLFLPMRFTTARCDTEYAALSLCDTRCAVDVPAAPGVSAVFWLAGT
jgi:hypothetical protein